MVRGETYLPFRQALDRCMSEFPFLIFLNQIKTLKGGKPQRHPHHKLHNTDWASPTLNRMFLLLEVFTSFPGNDNTLYPRRQTLGRAVPVSSELGESRFPLTWEVEVYCKLVFKGHLKNRRQWYRQKQVWYKSESTTKFIVKVYTIIYLKVKAHREKTN